MVTIYLYLMLLPVPFILICLLYKASTTQYQYSEIDADTFKWLRTTRFDLLGHYDEYAYHSLRLWCYGIEVFFYRQNIGKDIHSMLIDWNDTSNKDERGLFREAIEWAHTEYLRDFEMAREKKEPVKFATSPLFNYKELPRTLQYNDYVDMQTIIGYIDEILEVRNEQ